ncbi:MAG TPA: hypothetical protein VIE40_07650 [Dehalococcoidia bacterium]
MILLSAPVPIVPALFVALFAIGTAAGFVITQRALTVTKRAHADTDHASAAADEARAALSVPPAADARATYAHIDAVLRRYLDTRFGLATASLPGPEIERALTRAGVTRPAARLTSHLLERCARMSDATTLASPGRVEADLQSAREIVDLTA